MVEKILNNTTLYGKIRASHEDSLHSSTLISIVFFLTETISNECFVDCEIITD